MQTDIDRAIQAVEANEQATPGFVPAVDSQAFREVRNLLWARNNLVFKVALEEWDRKERLLSARLERREKQKVDLINQIFNLVGFYSVFQGVVLTAVSQLAASSESQCGKVWFPIVLSLVAAVVALIGLWLRFKKLKELEDSINIEKKALAEPIRRRQRLLDSGEAFRFFRDTRFPEVKDPKSLGKDKIGALAALIVVTVVFIVSYLVILCDLGYIERLRNGL
jgi:uncharacterized membrane protein